VRLFSALLLVALSGCGGDEPPVAEPDPLLVAALADLHLADARADLTGTARDSLRALALARHGLSTADLAEVLDGLVRDPEGATRLYDRVSERLAAGTAAPPRSVPSLPVKPEGAE